MSKEVPVTPDPAAPVGLPKGDSVIEPVAICPVCKLAIHSQGHGGGILIQASIGTFTSGHSHAICECGWWAQAEDAEAVRAEADKHHADHMTVAAHG